jgi:hypothetical protein
MTLDMMQEEIMGDLIMEEEMVGMAVEVVMID